MKRNVRADLKRFYCQISFFIECSKSDFEKVVKHYEGLCLFYSIKGNFDLNNLTEPDESFEYFSFELIIEKSMKNYHLSTTALRNIFLNDLEIIRQLYYINDPIFECPYLSEKIYP